ncbi:MAG: hypothetical protein IJL14_00815, partial [Selenomonadaceae bacterium]|nr:hypothetical protein [Selenomonadaceae bacterium]
GGYENENGDLVLFNSGSGSYCLQVDINEDLFYIYGKFPKAIEVANKETVALEDYAISPEALDAAVEAETELANVEPCMTVDEKVAAYVQQSQINSLNFVLNFCTEKSAEFAKWLDMAVAENDSHNANEYSQFISTYEAKIAEIKAALAGKTPQPQFNLPSTEIRLAHQDSLKARRRGFIMNPDRLKITFTDGTFKFQHFHYPALTFVTIAKYDTAEEVEQVINLLKDAVNRGDKSFKFPTFTVNNGFTESELAEIQRDLAEPITEATITPTLDDLKKNSRLYAVSGKALAALAFGINAPIDCDDETADQYEQAFQAVKTARDKFNESRKNFIKQYDQTEANIKARAKKRLSKVSTQVLDMLQNIPTAAAIALKFMPSTPRNFTFDTERFGLDSYTAENKVVKIGEDTIEYDANGKIEWVVSDKYGALLQFLPSGEIAYFTKPLRDDGKSFYNELDRWCVNDFFLNLAERGACIIGDPKPTDDFASKLAELESKEAEARAAVEKAKVALLAAQNVRDEAEAEYRKARKEISRLLNMTASKLTEKIWELSLDAMTLNNQDGKSFKAQHGGTVTPHIEHTFKISNGWKVCGYYDTPAQVTCVIEMLTAAVNTGKTEFTFPTIDELNQANFTADSLKEVTV